MYIYLAFNLASVRSKTGRQIRRTRALSTFPSMRVIPLSSPSARQRTIIADKACHEMLSSSCSFVLPLVFRRSTTDANARSTSTSSERNCLRDAPVSSRVSNSKYHVKKKRLVSFLLLLLLLLLLWILTKLTPRLKLSPHSVCVCVCSLRSRTTRLANQTPRECGCRSCCSHPFSSA